MRAHTNEQPDRLKLAEVSVADLIVPTVIAVDPLAKLGKCAHGGRLTPELRGTEGVRLDELLGLRPAHFAT